MEYDKMLDRLYLSLPKQALTKERFEMPKVESIIQGNKTIIQNFGQVVKTFHREAWHVIKFVTKEVATGVTEEQGRLILNSKFNFKQISKIFESYAKQFVLCHECEKPDTKIVDYQGVKMMQCEACGASKSVPKL